MQQRSQTEARERFFNRAEAAEYIRATYGIQVAKTTLQKYVTVGGGPAYRLFGRNAVYSASDLDAWVQRKLSAPRMSSSGH
ncbi:MAG TPA: hypothetical protein PL143_00855 [Rhodocyclaceae bacterium]|nr:hypothetical protein [Rhodocyclaceae bacterium]